MCVACHPTSINQSMMQLVMRHNVSLKKRIAIRDKVVRCF